MRTASASSRCSPPTSTTHSSPRARHGLYATSLVDDIAPQRLRRFFVEEGGGYRITKALREMVVFARQNLIADPPFSRMDLISCRNLLIYLEPSLQKKAIPSFHYALKPKGFLLLGASESIGGFTDLFEPIDKKHKIYSRKPATATAVHLPVPRTRGQPVERRPPLPIERPGSPDSPDGRGELDAQREADRIAVHQYAPPGVLVNAELAVLQFRGSTGAFLEPPAGKASFDVLKMAREGLMLPLRSAINQAKKENKTARKANVRVSRNGTSRTVNLEVIPLNNLRERCFLILFEDVEHASRGRRSRSTEAEPARATRAVSGRIDVTLESDGDLARIRVSDSGIGIIAEFLPHIFEVFTQSPRALDRAKGGLGLGLPLARRLVEMHEGHIEATSPGVGQGSEFVVTLPRLVEERPHERAAPAGPPGRGNLQPRRILVVDDEATTGELLAELLEEQGHQTLAVVDGPAALAALRTFDPEVVLMDIGLPGMDGYEVARRLREEYPDRKLLLIALTGYQNDDARLQQAGFDQHLLKPADMPKLAASLAAWNDRETEPR